MAPPPLSDLPAHNKGFITFGSFNNFPKLNRKVYNLWGKILLNVADSKLVLKTKSLGNAAVRKQVYDSITTMGISRERIILLSHEPSYHRHLGRYHEIDIPHSTPFPITGRQQPAKLSIWGYPSLPWKGMRIVHVWV